MASRPTPWTLSNRSGLTLRGQKISSIHNLNLTTMTALAKETRRQSIEESFIQHIEQIYYPGFTEEMTDEQYLLFEWELRQYQKNHQFES